MGLTGFVVIHVFIASFSPVKGEYNQIVNAKFTRPVKAMPISSLLLTQLQMKRLYLVRGPSCTYSVHPPKHPLSRQPQQERNQLMKEVALAQLSHPAFFFGSSANLTRLQAVSIVAREKGAGLCVEILRRPCNVPKCY